MSGFEESLRQVCELLVHEGRLAQDDYEYVLRLRDSEGGNLDDLLISAGLLSEDIFLRRLARFAQCRYLEEDQLRHEVLVDDALMQALPPGIFQQHSFVPLAWDRFGAELRIALARMPSQAFLEHLASLASAREVRFDFAKKSALTRLLYDPDLPFGSAAGGFGVDGFGGQELVCAACGLSNPGEMLFCESCGEALREELKGHALQPGTLIGPFQIEKLIGAGGMAEVYRAVDLRSDRVAALKVLQSQLSTMRSAIQRFQREAKTLRQLRHPSIVRFFEFGFQEGVGLYIATEYLQGKEFLDLLQEGQAVAMDTIRAVVEQVCDALAYAHQHEVIHRDLKPDNIILTEQDDGQRGPVKLIDFGIAKILDDSMARTQTGLVLGTPRYMSPEQVSNQKVDYRSDIYSLAVILFEALTGQCLFDAESGHQMMLRQLYAPAPSLTEARPDLIFPPALVTLLSEALSKEPQDRPASMLAFRERFLEATVGEGVEPEEDEFQRTFFQSPANEDINKATIAGGYGGLSELEDFIQPEDLSGKVERELDAFGEKLGQMDDDEFESTLLGDNAGQQIDFGLFSSDEYPDVMSYKATESGSNFAQAQPTAHNVEDPFLSQTEDVDLEEDLEATAFMESDFREEAPPPKASGGAGVDILALNEEFMDWDVQGDAPEPKAQSPSPAPKPSGGKPSGGKPSDRPPKARQPKAAAGQGPGMRPVRREELMKTAAPGDDIFQAKKVENRMAAQSPLDMLSGPPKSKAARQGENPHDMAHEATMFSEPSHMDADMDSPTMAGGPNLPKQPRIDWERQQPPPTRKPPGAPLGETLGSVLRVALYVGAFVVIGYLVWFLFFDTEDQLPRRRAPIMKPVQPRRRQLAVQKRMVPTPPVHRKRVQQRSKAPRTDGRWERQYRLVWKWDPRRKEFRMVRRWMKVWVPKKKRRKKKKR